MKTINFFLMCIIFALMISENLLAGDATISGNIVRKTTTTSTSSSIPIKDCNGNTTGYIAGITTSVDSYPAYTAFTTVTIKIFAKDTAGSPVSTISGLSKADIGFNSSTGAFSYSVTGIAASRYSYIAKVCLDADLNSAYVREFTISTGGAIFPIGSVIAYAGNATTVADLETSGWYKCDGRAISSLTASLSADEISAFQNVVGSNLPDLRGVFLRGLDEGRGWDDNRTTRTGGESTYGVRSYQGCKVEDITLTGSTNSDGNHRHYINLDTDPGGWARQTDDGGATGTAAENSGTHTHHVEGWSDYAGSHSHTVSVSYSAGAGSETRPENIAVYYLIRGR
jgi:hypothetical protein